MEPMPTGAGGGPPEPVLGPKQAAAILGVAFAMVLTIVLGGFIGYTMGGGNHGMNAMAPQAQGMMLDALPADVAVHYQYAAAHPGDYGQMACYCGCQATLDHKSLLDCFVRPSGGWDPHASGCAVCVQESQMVRHMLEMGRQPSAISVAIDAKFGGLSTT